MVEFNPLDWWKDHKSKFPFLINTVKTIFCIPATSVPSERAFSTAGNIVTKKRNRLVPQKVEMFSFFKQNFKYIPKNTSIKSEVQNNVDYDSDSE